MKKVTVSILAHVDAGKTKLSDLRGLLAAGKNIATTHALFTSYTEDIRESIKRWGYVLVLDEVVDVLSLSNLSRADIKILLSGNVLEEGSDGSISWVADYDDPDVNHEFRFEEEEKMSRSRNLVRSQDGNLFWAATPELFTCFSEAYVLTYMFYAQNLRCFFDANCIPYELIGVRMNNGIYEFCDIGQMDRRRELRDKIHILAKHKLNSIGEKRSALSYSWYRRRALSDECGEFDLLSKNIYNVFHNIYGASAYNALWTSFDGCRRAISSKRYAKSFLVFNAKATNAYTHKKYLAYCVNNFARPIEARYYREHGVKINEDGYALSIMIQWVFRSAIRKDEEIWIYIPSARMRTLFIRWLDLLAEGKDLDPVKYKKGEIDENL